MIIILLKKMISLIFLRKHAQFWFGVQFALNYSGQTLLIWIRFWINWQNPQRPSSPDWLIKQISANAAVSFAYNTAKCHMHEVRGVTLRILKQVDFWALMSVAMFPSHVPFQQRQRPSTWRFSTWRGPSAGINRRAIAQGYVVSTHKRSDNLRWVKEIQGVVIRKVSAQFSTWRGP